MIDIFNVGLSEARYSISCCNIQSTCSKSNLNFHHIIMPSFSFQWKFPFDWIFIKYRLSYSFIVMGNNKSMQISWAILYFQIELNENAFRNLVNMPSWALTALYTCKHVFLYSFPLTPCDACWGLSYFSSTPEFLCRWRGKLFQRK